jgi:fructose-1,6-bisphosphatase/inositol monophosphatase family enzyme
MTLSTAQAALDKAVHALLVDVSQKVILPRYQNLSAEEVEEKAADDLVTIADREAEAMLSEGLASIRGDLAIVGEEAAHADERVLERLSDPCWIIDPVDGTNNFAQGKPPFGIIIAMADGGETQAGWLYDPLKQRFCSAHLGQGAYLNGEQMTARTTGEDPPVAAISLIFLTDEERAMVEARLAGHYQLTDIPRCAAEQYPRLALGENDVSSFKRTLPWDHAAGILWLNEAGGCAQRLDGSAYRVDEPGKPGLIGASSPKIWDVFAARALAARD